MTGLTGAPMLRRICLLLKSKRSGKDDSLRVFSLVLVTVGAGVIILLYQFANLFRI